MNFCRGANVPAVLDRPGYSECDFGLSPCGSFGLLNPIGLPACPVVRSVSRYIKLPYRKRTKAYAFSTSRCAESATNRIATSLMLEPIDHVSIETSVTMSGRAGVPAIIRPHRIESPEEIVQLRIRCQFLLDSMKWSSSSNRRHSDRVRVRVPAAPECEYEKLFRKETL